MKTMNKEQQRLVEENLNVVDIILHTRIQPNRNITGMEYDDLYAVGCLALCKAAETYTGQVKFVTYASKVVYNAVIDECRRAMQKYRNSVGYDASVAGEDSGTFEEFLKAPDSPDSDLECKELLSIISEAKHTCKGAVLKGVEAIELLIKGYSGKEIAALYGVTDCHVTSWISKARSMLRKKYPEYVCNE